MVLRLAVQDFIEIVTSETTLPPPPSALSLDFVESTRRLRPCGSCSIAREKGSTTCHVENNGNGGARARITDLSKTRHLARKQFCPFHHHHRRHHHLPFRLSRKPSASLHEVPLGGATDYARGVKRREWRTLGGRNNSVLNAEKTRPRSHDGWWSGMQCRSVNASRPDRPEFSPECTLSKIMRPGKFRALLGSYPKLSITRLILSSE